MWSKQTICTYVAREATQHAEAGYPDQRDPARPDRHARSPRPTPRCGWASAPTSATKSAIEASTPDEQAGPLVFLCSDAARYVNGITMITDAGYVAPGLTKSFPAAKPVVDFLYFRFEQ